jgi:sugar-phosphatase
VVEDAPIGATAARAAGMRLIALTTTHRAEQLEPADLILPDLTGLAVRIVERTNGARSAPPSLEIARRD